MSWDDIHAGARFIREQTALSKLYQEEARRLNAENAGIKDTKQRFHMVCAEIGAAESILKDMHPEHPYFRVRDSIRAAGLKVALTTDNTDDSYAAGANFPLPPYTPPNLEADRLRAENKRLNQELFELGLKISEVTAECRRLRAQVQEGNSGIESLKEALRTLQRDCAHHMALHYAFRQELAKAAPRHQLVASVQRRQELAHSAYEVFVAERSWEAVKRFGEGFLQQREASREQEYEQLFAQQGAEVDQGNQGAQGEHGQQETQGPSGYGVSVSLAAAQDSESEVVRKLKQELAEMERDCVHHIALEFAFRRELSVADERNVLLNDLARRQKLADEAYQMFEQKRDWDAVKDFGRQYLSSRQPD